MEYDATTPRYDVLAVHGFIVEETMYIVKFGLFHIWIENHVVPVACFNGFPKSVILDPLLVVKHINLVV